MKELISRWQDVPVTGTKKLPPDPKFMRTIGHNYATETALADIIDNSIDAGARNVLIRFIREGSKLVGLLIVDNGRGMDAKTLDRAMTVGSPRNYEDAALGHFGIGLKAASLGQADSLTVLSRSNSSTHGRRWKIEKATNSFECEIVDKKFAADAFAQNWGFGKPTTGTIVRWDRVKVFPKSEKEHVVEAYLEDTIVKIRQHLGLVFHRFLEAQKIEICIDVEDVAINAVGAAYIVTPVNPFGYVRSSRPKYPKTLKTKLGGRPLTLECHIWPGRSQLGAFKLPGGAPEKFQGFYFYRHDRLLQMGGWNHVTIASRELQLARVAVEIGDIDVGFFSMNPEKTKVESGIEFLGAVESAKSRDGSTFEDYLTDATSAFKQSRKRNTVTRAKVVPPGKGFDAKVKRVVRDELGFLVGEEPVDIRWDRIESNDFFEIDRDNRLIRINRRYRQAVVGEGTLNDAPLVKSLLFLLVEQLFQSAYLSARAKDTIEYLQAILTTAAEAELT